MGFFEFKPPAAASVCMILGFQQGKRPPTLTHAPMLSLKRDSQRAAPVRAAEDGRQGLDEPCGRDAAMGDTAEGAPVWGLACNALAVLCALRAILGQEVDTGQPCMTMAM